jgi:radical SAM protein with 4Fe4S-binding SPASM domain
MTTSTAPSKVQRRLTVLESDHFPAYVVWELTLRCDHACAHCGSRAGGARDDELTTEKALAVVDELAAMRTKEVVLIGGEAYLHPGFLDVVRALKARGIRPSMTTGGKGIDKDLARAMKEAGVHGVSVSVDGLEREHNAIRQSKHSFSGAMAALAHLKAAGILIAANTNINRVNAPVLEALFDVLVDAGISAWQVQITVPLGRAADRPQMLLQPYDLLDVVPRLAKLKERALARGVVMMPGNNLGYFGPEEALLRSPHDARVAGAEKDHWRGCQAGKRVMGIESDGGVKGCPSLQPAYVGGSLKDRALKDLWDHTAPLAFNRARTVDDLWGFCRTCPFAEVCLAGCTFTAHALFGRPGNNPYCHYRARTLAAQGRRERLVAAEAASGLPFDHGLFTLVEEALDADDAGPDADRSAAGDAATAAGLVRITRAPLRT